MIVTEGKKSRSGRLICLLAGPGLFAVATVLFARWPRAAVPVLWIATVTAAAVVLRYVVLSVAVRFLKRRAPEDPERFPSLAIIIPCLNERPALEGSVPALLSLEAGGEIRFCYVCEPTCSDGTTDFIRHWSARDARVVLIEKDTPPGGRGAAIAYGLERAPRSEVVGFLDADHVIDEASLAAVARRFEEACEPMAIQGACLTSNESHGLLPRLLSVERQWLERAELGANSRLGGVCSFGSGQGFLSRALFDEHGFAIDESMVLDDVDLSCALLLKGVPIVFAPEVSTRSLQPASVWEFVDQRYRWARGWLDLLRKYRPWAGVRAPMRLLRKLDFTRLILFPHFSVLFPLGFAAAAGTLIAGMPTGLRAVLTGISLLWPLAMGVMPFVARYPGERARHRLLTVVGVPVLFVVYLLLVTSAFIEAYVLHRRPRYAKTTKGAGPGPPAASVPVQLP